MSVQTRLVIILMIIIIHIIHKALVVVINLCLLRSQCCLFYTLKIVKRNILNSARRIQLTVNIKILSEGKIVTRHWTKSSIAKKIYDWELNQVSVILAEWQQWHDRKLSIPNSWRSLMETHTPNPHKSDGIQYWASQEMHNLPEHTRMPGQQTISG